MQLLRARLDEHAGALGFDQVGVAGIELPEDEANLERWLGEERDRKSTRLNSSH